MIELVRNKAGNILLRTKYSLVVFENQVKLDKHLAGLPYQFKTQLQDYSDLDIAENLAKLLDRYGAELGFNTKAVQA